MTKCRWFLLCDNPAVTTLPHPILGAVPICQHCKDKMLSIEAAVKRASGSPDRPGIPPSP